MACVPREHRQNSIIYNTEVSVLREKLKMLRFFLRRSRAWTRLILPVFMLVTGLLLVPNPASAQNANRLTYLDAYSDPYYPNLESAILTTPQWVGEKGVEAVITLGIDDMRDPKRYENYLRPILDRLKKIDGRAPVSIMTNQVDPSDPQLQTWLREGLSIECHTIDHPCPCLNGGDFAKAKSTYDRCVDLMNKIPGNTPVAFRFPCMDSLNTPSPRAYAEILNRTTKNGNSLQASTSVTCLFTPADPSLRSIFKSGQAREENRFKKYVPFPSFVNQIQNYPYPYLIGNQCWEFPCTIPDDWQGQNLHRPHNPKTVEDLKAAVDATFLKKGVANIIFHPHAWIRAEQIVEVINHAENRYGRRIKFLTFKECMERLNRFMLNGVPVRHPKTGANNGVKIFDINGDGYQDVFVGNQKRKFYRLWDPQVGKWNTFQHSLLVKDLRFGTHQGRTVLAVPDNNQIKIYAFSENGTEIDGPFSKITVGKKTTTNHLRFRDINGDSNTEVIIASPGEAKVFSISGSEPHRWQMNKVAEFPASVATTDGLDNGLRFVDIDEDGFDDIVVSNDKESAVYLNEPNTFRFEKIKLGTELPRIVSQGKNQGVWFANQHLWVQNEHTHRLPDGVDRRSFAQILAKTDPRPQSAEASLRSIVVPPEFKVELMAAEPLVMDPIAMEWGVDGKLWVVEMADYPLGLDDKGKPGGRVRYLEDTDQDGRYDKSTVFVDGIPFPTGVLPLNTDADHPVCLISAAPYVVVAGEKTSWNKLIKKERAVLLQGFGEGNQQHRFNGFSLGLDNWIYLANGDSGGTIVDPRTHEKLNINGRDLRMWLGDPVEFEAQTGQTQFGRHRDAWGNWFGCNNSVPLRHYILPDHYTRRNPHYKYPSPRLDIATVGNTQLFPISRILSHWSGYRSPAPGQPHRYTSAASTDFYRDSLFGPEFENNTFTCEPVHNLVQRRVLLPDGVRYKSVRHKSESKREFLASSDSWFRPTTVKTGPDGALWVVDMYRLVIEHPEWIDDEREKELFLRAGHDRGRIYRIFPRDKQPGKLPQPIESNLTSRLIQMLQSDNRWHTETAQRLLIELGKEKTYESVAPQLEKILLHHKSPLARLHALCTLAGRYELSSSLWRRALQDEHWGVRKNAVRIGDRYVRKQPAFQSALRALVADEHPQVRMQVAFTLGESGDPADGRWLAQLGAQDYEDPYIRAAVFSSLHKKNIEHVIQRASELKADPRFIMTLLEQASAMGKPELATHSLTGIFNTPNLQTITTRQLELVVQVYSTLGAIDATSDLAKLAKRFESRIENTIENESSARRNKAILQLLARSPFAHVSTKLDQLAAKLSPSVDVLIQKAVLQEWARFNAPEAGQILIDKWRSLTPAVRKEALAAIMQRSGWSQCLLNEIQSGHIDPQEFSSRQKNEFLRHPDQSVAQLAAKTFQPVPVSNMGKLVNDYLKKMNAHKTSANIARGKKLFEKHCSQCHLLDSVGKSIGPDLRALKDRSEKTILQAIIRPNLAVEDKYRSYIVALDDGRELVGMIQSESSNQIKLATADGRLMELFRKNVERMKSTGKSLMPEGLAQEISPAQMLDLVSFVIESIDQAGPLQKIKSFPGNKPAIVTADAAQKILMLATTCEIFGPSLVFENKYKNLGFWGSPDDLARWNVNVPQAGKYDVWIDYACPDNTAGNVFEFSMAGQKLTDKTQGTGSWDNYKRIKLGTLAFEEGNAIATIRSIAPQNNFLMDLKGIELVPQKRKSDGP